jgi:hypothetical protein
VELDWGGLEAQPKPASKAMAIAGMRIPVCLEIFIMAAS